MMASSNPRLPQMARVKAAADVRHVVANDP
jgi:hypothetical protein